MQSAGAEVYGVMVRSLIFCVLAQWFSVLAVCQDYLGDKKITVRGSQIRFKIKSESTMSEAKFYKF